MNVMDSFQKNNLTFIQDGEVVNENIISHFSLPRKDTMSTTRDGVDVEVSNFVGMVYKGDEVLVSLPKHYSHIGHAEDSVSAEELGQTDIDLLFRVMTKKRSAKTDEIIGKVDSELDSNYPLNAFFDIYEYYQRYGLYRETETLSHPNGRGIVSWRDTIRKSSNIISKNRNLILLPLYKREKRDKAVFLTECMTFAIQHTLQQFRYALRLPFQENMRVNPHMLKYGKQIVKRLRYTEHNVFKDINKNLIRALIAFFETVPPRMDYVIIKTYNFESTWEKIVEEFLNRQFLGFDESSGLLKFDSLKENNFNFNTQVKRYVNAANLKQSIRLDYFTKHGQTQYIFDAKYYRMLYEINYKQLVYHFLLKDEAKKTISALIIPTDGDSKQSPNLHFDINHIELNKFDEDIKIYIYELNVRNGMKLYMDIEN